MPITLLNAAMLVGLLAVLIPPIIHLLNRRRYDVVPWGAMQFLQVSEQTRRKVFLEEILLMVLRMGLIALMVIALAAPIDKARWFEVLADKGRRDIALVIDGSYSMGYRGAGGTGMDAAKAWAMSLLDELGPDDKVALIVSRQRPAVLAAEPSRDFDVLRTMIQTLPQPRGSCDGPAAIQAAIQALAKSSAGRREIIVLTDGQRRGWTDESSMLGWDSAAGQLGENGPRVWMVNLDPDRPADPPNRSVSPLRASRVIASTGQQVTFRGALQRRGAGQQLPTGRLRLSVDNKSAGDVPLPNIAGDKGQTPFTIAQRFAAPGSHLVTVQSEPDAMPGDDRQDFALEVLPQLPVLLIDGDPNPAAARGGAEFLRDALAPARDPSPSVLVKSMPVSAFSSADATRDIAGPGTAPRVIALCNVARLTLPQQSAIAAFLESGGGVLVTCGERSDANHYNQDLHRAGRGWLPAALAQQHGDVSNLAHAAQPLADTFFHPALELFREAQAGGLGDARFPRYWKLSVPTGTTAIAAARLVGDDPFVVEKTVGAGRVLQFCVPLDNSWGTNLIELPAFAPLAHELVYYLAGARSAAQNLAPGQPLRYKLPNGVPTSGWRLQPPDGPERPIEVKENQIVFEETQEPGVYQLRHPANGIVRYFVVQSDIRESDLSPWTDAEREQLTKRIAEIQFENDRQAILSGILKAPQPAELWWVMMLGVIVLLAGELWLTRRRALGAV